MKKASKKKQRFAYRDGARYSVSPEIAGNELERIYDENGRLTPQTVVDESRPKTAPLHPIFEWNDKIAANEHRKQVARNLIRCVVKEETRAPVYVHVPKFKDDEGGYQPVRIVVQRPDDFALALAQLVRKAGELHAAAVELQKAAEQAGNPDMVAKVAVVIATIGTAREAVSTLH